MTSNYSDRTITLPYTSLELKLALLDVEKRITDKDFLDRLITKIKKIVPEIDKAEYNKELASYNGITVETLINSPNYVTLQKEYTHQKLKKVAKLLIEEKFSEIESWAIIAIVLGLI